MNLIFLGSSVTYGSASNGWSMCDYLSEQYGCNVKKYAVSGTTLARYGNQSYVERLETEVDKNAPCDFFICQLSTNDANLRHVIPLGTISTSKNKEDFDTKTVIGAIEYIIATVKENWNCPISFYTGTKYDNKNYQEMVDALKELQAKWDIGIINLWDDAEMNAVSKEDYAKYMADGVHPTKLGYEEWWGPKFVQHLMINKK